MEKKDKDEGATNKNAWTQRKPGTHSWCQIAQEQALEVEKMHNEMKEKMLLLKKNKNRRNATDLAPKNGRKRNAQDRKNAMKKKRGEKEAQVNDTKNEEKECEKPLMKK